MKFSSIPTLFSVQRKNFAQLLQQTDVLRTTLLMEMQHFFNKANVHNRRYTSNSVTPMQHFKNLYQKFGWVQKSATPLHTLYSVAQIQHLQKQS
jgi:hypothetical protein